MSIHPVFIVLVSASVGLGIGIYVSYQWYKILDTEWGYE